MRAFDDYNPIVIFLCLIFCAGIAMFSLNPIIILISLAGAAALWFVRNGMSAVRSHLIYIAIILILPLLNLFFSHNGATVLLVINDNPVTLESLLYGFWSAMMLVSVLYWFRTFSQIMTSDKLLYLMGSVSPKLALILTMALRYVPLLSRQAKKIDNAQRVLGMYKDDNIIDSSKGRLRVFSILITWGLENGIITADSMTARGYGVGRRTAFSLFRFRRGDAVAAGIILILLCVIVVGMAQGVIDYSYYPKMDAVPCSFFPCLVYACYGTTAFLPTIIELEVRIKWHSLRSKI